MRHQFIKFNQKYNLSGYTMVEMLGVIGIIMILVTIGTLGYNNFKASSEMGAADHNSATLNSAIEQYNQSGGLMTAQVPMVVGVETLDASAAVMQVYCRLASAEIAPGSEGGGFMATHQKPILSNDPNDFRSVWISGITNTSGEELTNSYKTASGVRNPLLEAKLESGEIEGGKFVTVGPDLYAKYGVLENIVGIKSFSRNGEPCSSSYTIATPPPAGPVNLQLSLSDPSAGVVTGSGTYTNGETVVYTVTPAPGWEFKNWTDDMAGKPEDGSIVLLTTVTGIAVMHRIDVTVVLTSSPAEAGSVSGSGKYKYGDKLVFSAVANDGWKFARWDGSLSSETASGDITLTGDITSSAVFEQDNFAITITEGIGGTTQPDPGTYLKLFGDTMNVIATPTWSDTWNQPRYRWDGFESTAGGTTTTIPAINYSFTVTQSVKLTPVFVQQFLLDVSVNFTERGTIEGSPNGIHDINTPITLKPVPAIAPDGLPYGFLRWEGDRTGEENPLNFDITSDTRLTAIFVEDFDLLVRAVDAETGSPIPANAYTLTGLTLGTNPIRVSTTKDFTIVPASGWVFDRVDGASSFVDAADKRSKGVEGEVIMDTPKIVTFYLKRTPLAFYWNKAVAPGTAGKIQKSAENGYQRAGIDVFPVISKNQQGMDFLATKLGTEYKFNFSSGSTNSTNRWPIYQGYQCSFCGWHQDYMVQVTVTNWKYEAASSSNIFILDADTGDFIGSVGRAEGVHITQSLNAPYTSQGVNGAVKGYFFAAGIKAYTTTDGGSYRYQQMTPVILDLANTGSPDLLAGPLWAPSSFRSPNIAAMRVFDLDSTGKKNWEWVGASAGILVWNPEGNVLLQPTAKELFGGYTFGERWDNGYQALASLDVDNSGKLEGKELDSVWVWVDANSDAIVQDGELKSAKAMNVTFINATADPHEGTGFFANEGAGIQNEDGSVTGVMSWDWISLGGFDEAGLTNLEAVQSSLASTGGVPMATYHLEIPAFVELGSLITFTVDQTGRLQVAVTAKNVLNSTFYSFKYDNGSVVWEGEVLQFDGSKLLAKFEGKFNEDTSILEGTVTVDAATYTFKAQAGHGLTFKDSILLTSGTQD